MLFLIHLGGQLSSAFHPAQSRSVAALTQREGPIMLKLLPSAAPSSPTRDTVPVSARPWDVPTWTHWPAESRVVLAVVPTWTAPPHPPRVLLLGLLLKHLLGDSESICLEIWAVCFLVPFPLTACFVRHGVREESGIYMPIPSLNRWSG